MYCLCFVSLLCSPIANLKVQFIKLLLTYRNSLGVYSIIICFAFLCSDLGECSSCSVPGPGQFGIARVIPSLLFFRAAQYRGKDNPGSKDNQGQVVYLGYCTGQRQREVGVRVSATSIPTVPQHQERHSSLLESQNSSTPVLPKSSIPSVLNGNALL